MANVLVVAELSEDGKLKKSTLSAISFARQALPAVGGALHIVVLGSSTSAACAELAAYGAAKIIAVEDATLAHYTAEHYAPSVVAAAQGTTLVATASSFGKDLLPRVAARLDAAYAGDCSAVSVEGGKLVYKRPMFAGNASGYCTLETPVQVATARQSEFSPAEPSGGSSPIEKLAKAAVGAGYTLFRGGGAATAAKAVRPIASAQTRSAPRSVPAAPRSMPATRPATTRSAKPEKSWHPSCTWPSASPAPSSTSPA